VERDAIALPFEALHVEYAMEVEAPKGLAPPFRFPRRRASVGNRSCSCRMTWLARPTRADSSSRKTTPFSRERAGRSRSVRGTRRLTAGCRPRRRDRTSAPSRGSRVSTSCDSSRMVIDQPPHAGLFGDAPRNRRTWSIDADRLRPGIPATARQQPAPRRAPRRRTEADLDGLERRLRASPTRGVLLPPRR
jgi:hypothetical protein